MATKYRSRTSDGLTVLCFAQDTACNGLWLDSYRAGYGWGPLAPDKFHWQLVANPLF